MRFTIFASPGADPGEGRSRASTVVPVRDRDELAAAAAACADPYILVLAPGARPRTDAFNGLTTALVHGPGVLGGACDSDDARVYGWMLAPAPCGPLPFELNLIAARRGTAGNDAAVRGPIDVVAPGMVLARREFLIEPLPRDPVAASIELCARARSAGRSVECRPAFACTAPQPNGDDRGRAAALREIAERRPELRGTHRLPQTTRVRTVERNVRLDGGRYVRMRASIPSITLLIHGDGAEAAVRRVRALTPAIAFARACHDAAVELRAEMRVRGDRYVVVTHATMLPDATTLDSLIEAVEEGPHVAIAAPNADALDGRCVLVAIGRFPQHVVATGSTIADAMRALVSSAHRLRRAVRAPGYAPPPAATPAPRRAAIVFPASSSPAVTKMTIDGVLAAARNDDELIAVCAANAQTTQRLFAAYPQIGLELDAVDPLLADGTNRAIGACTRELVVLIADDVLVTPGALDRLRRAFERLPSLGAAFACVAGAPGGEGVHDTTYTDMGKMRALAEARQQSRPREMSPIDFAVTPAVAIAREALEAVGGIDTGSGPTRRAIADLVARLRAAGYAVVRCDDTLVHRFDPSISQNRAALADLQQPPASAPSAETIARGFDPERRVAFGHNAVPAARHDVLHAIAVPVGGVAELERGATFLAAAAQAFDAAAPVRIHILLDGTVTAAEAAARMRPVLMNCGRPMAETVAVRIERCTEIDAWRDALGPIVRVMVAAGHERPQLANAESVRVFALGELFEAAAP